MPGDERQSAAAADGRPPRERAAGLTVPARRRWLASVLRLAALPGSQFSPGFPAPSGSPDLSAGGRTTGPEVAAAGGDAVTGYLTDLLASTRDELNRADAKASLLLAAVGVIIGALIGGITGSQWSPLGMRPGEQALWWAGVAAAAVGLVLVSASVYPRIRQPRAPRPGPPAYYGDVAGYPDVDAFRRAVGQVPDATERLLNQAYVVSRIVQGKYVLLQRGLLALLVAIIACTLSVVLSVLLA